MGAVAAGLEKELFLYCSEQSFSITFLQTAARALAWVQGDAQPW